jgi:hypothetical protein
MNLKRKFSKLKFINSLLEPDADLINNLLGKKEVKPVIA